MAREILFRGKHICNGEWYEGSLLVWPNGSCMIKQFGEFPFENKNADVQPETVGQFTGLSDKNGKRIFEGDIITFPWDEEHPTELFEIVFNEGQYLAQPLAHDGKVWAITLNGYTHDMEVVGNIHDTPELLNGKES